MGVFLKSLDSPHSTGFGRADVDEWPEHVLDVLVDAGFLQFSGYARSVICRECSEGCSVDVEIIGGPGDHPPTAFHE